MSLTNPQMPAGRIRFTKPAPFRRPSVLVGSSRVRPRRWQHVAARDLAEGDVVPGIGLLRDIQRDEIRTGDEQLISERVAVQGGADNVATYLADELVWAFTAGPVTTADFGATHA